jgi:ABC-type transport system involved in cytochrome bd biosynthesis fused ATPase/permease subunit
MKRAGGQLALAGAMGTLAAVCSIGLLAVSAWLISRSAQHPPVLYLMVPVAAVQAFGIGRGVFRYAERLAGHDAALRILARLRMSAYDKLERLAPAGVAVFRSGDLISRLVTDVDSLTDRWLRVRLPYAVAALAGAGAVTVTAVPLPAAGLVLAPCRGEFAAATVDLLSGAGELSVFGTREQALRSVTGKSRRVARVQARSAYARASGAAVSTLAAGAALWDCLVLSVAGVRAGTLAGVTLAVLALMPLAVHEVFGGLAPAAQEIPRLRAASARVSEVLRHPDPVHEPARPARLPAPPYDITVRGLTVSWGNGDPDVLRGADLDLPAGARVAVTGPSGSGKTTAGHGAAAVSRPGRRHGDAGRHRPDHAGL